MQVNKYKNITASAQLKAGQGILVGFYVNSTNAGTIKIWDALTATGLVILNTTTPAVGYHSVGNVAFSVGLYATIAGTALDVTLVYK